MTEHKNIYSALSAAQASMAPPAKNAENPAFKKDGKPTKYADLDSVIDSVRVPLTGNGISWRHEMEHFGDQMCMTTYLDHGESGTQLKCPVPLIVEKKNMHGLKSAITYAKRIGLESVTGQAPGDDDDGNAAADAQPRNSQPITKQEPLRQEPTLFDKMSGALMGANDFQKLEGVWNDPNFIADLDNGLLAADKEKIKEIYAAQIAKMQA